MTAWHRARLLCLALAGLPWLACTPAAPTPAETATAPAPPPPDHPLEHAVFDQARHSARGMPARGAYVHGELGAGGKHDHLLVLPYGHCYRVVGAAGDGIADLDLLLYDPNGVQVRQDQSEDARPVLGLDAEVCPPQATAYRLQVRAYQGAGPYAFRVYESAE